MAKAILDFKFDKDAPVSWTCRFHPIDWWHEVGCPHREWTKEELQEALVNAKRSAEFAQKVAFGIE